MRLGLLFLGLLPGTAAGQLVFEYHAPSETVNYDPAVGEAAFTLLLDVGEDPANLGYPNDTQGFTMGLAHTSPLVPVAVDLTPILQVLNGGSGPDFFGPNLDPPGGPGIVLGVVYGFSGGVFLSFPQLLPVVAVSYETDPSALAGNTDGLVVPLTWVDSLGQPPVTNTVAVGTTGHPATVCDSEIQLVPAAPFIRGDANASGAIDGLSDALKVLLFQFVPGTPPPICLDAADANDDGSVNGLVDGLLLLNYQFQPGSPPPAPPGPDECGEDLMPDTLDCAEYGACP